MALPLVSYELERIWNQLFMAHARYYVGIQGYTGMTLSLDEWLLGFQRIIVASSQGQAILLMLAATHPTTQCHIAEDLNPQQGRCKNL